MTAVPGTGGRVGAGGRGETRIADRVVAKIAAHAAKEAVGVLPEDALSPRATVTVHRDTARVRISLELDYPTDIGLRCRGVRRRVTERLRTLTGMDVPEVAVRVERLLPTETGGASWGRAR